VSERIPSCNQECRVIGRSNNPLPIIYNEVSSPELADILETRMNLDARITWYDYSVLLIIS
jgi:hypothetical protein